MAATPAGCRGSVRVMAAQPWPPFVVAPDEEGLTVYGVDGGPHRIRLDLEGGGGIVAVTYERFQVEIRLEACTGPCPPVPPDEVLEALTG